MQIFFDDLALPRMTQTQLAETPEWKSHRAGFINDGTPSNLSVVRSMRGAIGPAAGHRCRFARRIARTGSGTRTPAGQPTDLLRVARREEIQARIDTLKNRLSRIPYLDPIDLRFRNRVKVRVPLPRQ